MPAIRKVSKVKSVCSQLNSLSKQAKKFGVPAGRPKKKENVLSLGDLISTLKSLVSNYKGKLTLKSFLLYADKKRVERAKKQLKIYYIASFKNGVFNFVAKSSGLGNDSSYSIRVQFKDIRELADTNMIVSDNIKEALLNTRIAVECSCDDYKYRFRYWMTSLDAIPDGGRKEYRFPKIVNPKSEHKFICKHSILVLNGITKPAFMNGIFKRYINNINSGKNTVRVKKEDIKKSLSSSKSSKIKSE